MTDQWRRVDAFPDYDVSSDGQVRRGINAPGRLQGRILRQARVNGYLAVGLTRDGKLYQVKVHKLVAEAFLGARPAGQQVNHINCLKTDNRACNLEWCTGLENMQHAARNGRIKSNPGELNGAAKLTWSEVREIRATYAAGGVTQRVLGAQFGVHQVLISCIVRGKIWKEAR